MREDERPEISAVIPCLNEAENAAAIAAAVAAQLAPITSSYEIIFIDNGSTDGTVPIIKLLRPGLRVRLIVNTRNFGQMRSPTHGIYEAWGRPSSGYPPTLRIRPNFIPELMSRWRAGALTCSAFASPRTPPGFCGPFAPSAMLFSSSTATINHSQCDRVRLLRSPGGQLFPLVARAGALLQGHARRDGLHPGDNSLSST